MARASWERTYVLLAVTFLVVSTPEAALLQRRPSRSTSDAVRVVFPRSNSAPHETPSPWEAGTFAAGVARAADRATGTTDGEHENDVPLDFSTKFLDKFPEWKNKRSETIIFPGMRSDH